MMKENYHKINLNTSNVNVNRISVLFMQKLNQNLNTSNVNVNRLTLPQVHKQGTLFKYI